MDAICFVLGLPAKYLRGKQLRDLIHDPAAERDGDGPAPDVPRPRRAWVKAIYTLDAREAAVLDLPPSTTSIEFMRTVASDGACTYRLRGDPVPLERYNDTLDKLGVVVAARNFLIFQVRRRLTRPRLTGPAAPPHTHAHTHTPTACTPVSLAVVLCARVPRPPRCRRRRALLIPVWVRRVTWSPSPPAAPTSS